MSGSADVHRAIGRVWFDSNLDWEFKKQWAEADRAKFESLNDGEAAPGNAWPYCVFEAAAPDTITRMTGVSGTSKLETRELPWIFRVFARETTDDNRSGKQKTADLVDLILQKFGGHPTIAPPEDLDFSLASGHLLQFQHQSDYLLRPPESDQEWVGVVDYLITADVPVAL